VIRDNAVYAFPRTISLNGLDYQEVLLQQRLEHEVIATVVSPRKWSTKRKTSSQQRLAIQCSVKTAHPPPYGGVDIEIGNRCRVPTTNYC